MDDLLLVALHRWSTGCHPITRWLHSGCTILKDPRDIFRPYHQTLASELDKDLGLRFRIMDAGMKSYPSSHLTHAAIEASANLHAKYQVRPEDAERIEAELLMSTIC
jgi:2-methylcitrate dehydratase PrpD